MDGGANPTDLDTTGVESVRTPHSPLTQTAPHTAFTQDLVSQYTVGVASGVAVTYISVGSSVAFGIQEFIDLANVLLAEGDLLNVLVTTCGFNEDQVSAITAKCVALGCSDAGE